MRHDICYRDNENGKADCDRKMLAELTALIPRGIREKVDRQLVRGIIGLKHRLGMGMWSSQLVDELHKPVRRRFQKRSVFAKQADDNWTADLVDYTRDRRVVTIYLFINHFLKLVIQRKIYTGSYACNMYLCRHS